MIYNSKDGFNTQYANDGCMWGRAVYFAVNASYSCGSYAHSIPNGYQLSDGSVLPNGTKVVLFAKA